MFRIIAIALALVLVASISSAQRKIGAGIPDQSEVGYTVILNSDEGIAVREVGYVYPSNRISFEFGAGFAGALYDCDFVPTDPATETDRCDVVTGMGSLNADVAAFNYEGERATFVLKITSPETAGTVSTLRIKGSDNIDISGGAMDVLVGGVAAVADVANPNDIDADGTYDDPIICTRTDAACMYYSAGGDSQNATGWWMASSTDTMSTTEWSAIQLDMLYRQRFEGDNTFNLAAFGTTCLDLWSTGEAKTLVECLSGGAAISFSRPITLVELHVIPVAQVAGSTVRTADDGCDFKLVTGDDLELDVTNGGWSMPPSNVATSIGDVQIVSVNHDLTAGAYYGISIMDGTFAQAGTPECVAAYGKDIIELWGFYR